jgi:hypothetical protein
MGGNGRQDPPPSASPAAPYRLRPSSRPWRWRAAFLHRCPELRSLPRVVTSVSTGNPFTAARPCGVGTTIAGGRTRPWATGAHGLATGGVIAVQDFGPCLEAGVAAASPLPASHCRNVCLQSHIQDLRIRFVNWSFILGWLVHLGKWSNEICSFPVIEEIKFWFR